MPKEEFDDLINKSRIKGWEECSRHLTEIIGLAASRNKSSRLRALEMVQDLIVESHKDFACLIKDLRLEKLEKQKEK